MVMDIHPIMYAKAPGRYTCIIRGESTGYNFSSTSFEVISGILVIVH